MDGDSFTLRWEEDKAQTSNELVSEEVIFDETNTPYNNVKCETNTDLDQIAAENLMFLSQDVVSFTDTAELDDAGIECVTEEVITEDWVVSDGQDRVEVPMEQLITTTDVIKEDNDIDVPLPTDQDEYTAMRPWPCDFCSRRFRKKAALVNHMVAHQNDRPHACNLCGVSYVRKCDLMNHLKVHAYAPDIPENEMDFDDVLENHQIVKGKKKRGRRKKKSESISEVGGWEHMTSARTQQWRGRGARARSPAPPAAASPPPSTSSSPPPALPSPPTPPPIDPSRPFVCRHCGVGFAREKALKSHSRVHGGDSPLECGVCGELCWSREALAQHARRRHAREPPPRRRRAASDRDHSPASDASPTRGPDYMIPTMNDIEPDEEDDDDDEEYQVSEPESPARGGGGGGAREARGSAGPREGGSWPELFCPHCGVAFQRADLLRRHVQAAHSYKRRGAGAGGADDGSGSGAHACDVCGEVCADALQLLAHAERHADRIKSRNRNRSDTNSPRQFPCRECGKVFGSRSSQQIHVRIHTGERPYACRFCWKAFADGGTLRKHERIHTGEKPYACAVCPRAFNQRVVLREHVRSHHSAPDRRANGGVSYGCVVCGRAASSAPELVQHLIQHCDANTKLKRMPQQSGPRKYKRRKKLKSESTESTPPSPARAPPSPPPRRARAPRPRPAAAPRAPRPRMIHTSPEPRPRTKQVRNRRPPRHPADDLLAIQPHLPRSPSPILTKEELDVSLAPEPTPEGAFRCEMCDLRFADRDSLLLHVPVHI